MKFLKSEAFEKHVEQAFPNHFSPLYGVVIGDAFERKFIIKRLLGKLQGEAKWMQAGEVAKESFLEEINSPNLFASKRILIYEEIDRLKKEETFFSKLKTLPDEVHVIVSGSVFHFYESLKREMILLDLSSEKPWERSSRLKRWLLQEVQKEGKSLTSDALTYLSEFCLTNFEGLMREIEKLVVYSGDKREIDLKAVRAVTALESAQNRWQLSEAIVWGETLHFATLHRLDTLELYPFLGQLRYQIQMGLVMSTCLERGEEKVIEQEYSKLPDRLLDKYKRRARALGVSYFRSRLQDLFSLECHLRMNRGKETKRLLDCFVARCLERGRND